MDIKPLQNVTLKWLIHSLAKDYRQYGYKVVNFIDSKQFEIWLPNQVKLPSGKWIPKYTFVIWAKDDTEYGTDPIIRMNVVEWGKQDLIHHFKAEINDKNSLIELRKCFKDELAKILKRDTYARWWSWLFCGFEKPIEIIYD